MIVDSWPRIFLFQKWKYIYSQWTRKEDIFYLLMILNVNRYANVVLESSLRANEGRIGGNEYINHNETNLDTNEWIFSGNEQQKLYYKTTDENIRDSRTARLMPREILTGYFPQGKAYTKKWNTIFRFDLKICQIISWYSAFLNIQPTFMLSWTRWSVELNSCYSHETVFDLWTFGFQPFKHAEKLVLANLCGLYVAKF